MNSCILQIIFIIIIWVIILLQKSIQPQCLVGGRSDPLSRSNHSCSYTHYDTISCDYHQNSNHLVKEPLIQKNQLIPSNKELIHPKILYLRNVYDQQIYPTLNAFKFDLQSQQHVRDRFRLSRQMNMCQQEYTDILQFIDNILNRLQSKNVYENYNPPIGETSYTIDKTNVYICIRNQDNQVHNDDILIFVFIHELAHVGNNTKGHDDHFWCRFRLLLDILCNYKPSQLNTSIQYLQPIKYCNVNLEKNPFYNYCNKQEITYNPLFDNDTFLTY